MVIKEYYKTREDGVALYRTCSDADFKIRKIGTTEVYDEAIDVANAPFSYEETAEPIDRGETLNE
jgi:hypothetical protein